MEPFATYDVETRAGTLRVNQWEKPSDTPPRITVVTVHPWAPLGGGEHNCFGLAHELSNEPGVARVLTFQLGSSSLVGGVITHHKREIQQIVDVCNWADAKFGDGKGTVILLGSSAGAPQAGAAIDACDAVIGLACVGYTFGRFASIAFGRHFKHVLGSSKPRLFIMGDQDEFTSVAQLEQKVAYGGRSGPCESIIVPRCGHFQLESPAYDQHVAQYIMEWIKKGNFLN
mmetsp:Transcript_29245/g.42415  ORF Transcript_29245/g.42415 Transcript_29245/m.42415 type:complete len:229 (+) Transcript_29245:156-842(+)